ncbi:MAG: response regulator [Gemmatimonadota bacterium]
MAGATTREANSPSTSVLLVSGHDWFASALQAVLEPEGFAFSRVRSARIALRDATLIDPDLVIIDEGLPDLDTPSLASALVAGPLGAGVPILVHSPNFWHETAQAAAMSAGAWDIIKEPVRSRLIVAKLRRLLEIKRLIEVTEQGSLSDMSTGLFNLAGLMRMMRVLGSTAKRANAVLSCVVLGPTTPASGGEALEEQRGRTATLCVENTREGDVCGWVGESDVGIVAYDTTAAGVATLVRRLQERASLDTGLAELLPLSAGIVELAGAAMSPEGSDVNLAPVATQIASLSRFTAAQNALQAAREAGGGVRVADSV